MKKIFTLATLLILALVSTTAFATDYYVSALIGNNSYSGTSPAQPFATIKKAADLTNPGDTVFIMNGTYTPVANFQQSIVTITRSGAAGAYITYKAYPGHTPKLQLLTGLNFQIWRAIAVDASYIVVSGLEIEGTNQLLNYTDAYQTWQEYENGIRDWNKISMYNCGSISIGGGAAVHHVVVKDCKIHDTGGGIGAFNCDYLTIENNLVYNTCWYSMYAGSGISILDPRSIDNVTSYKMFVRKNVVHNNKCLIPWERINALSDGNGIILDVNIGTSTTPAYVGRYLVENNVSYNNGGGGIHGFKARGVDIINNTAYNNGIVVGYPEIDANQCSDFRIYNNIMYARSGGNCNGNDANTIYDYNQYFNGPSFKNSPNDRTGDPLFVARGTTAAANFQLQAASPAINNGSNEPGQYSAVDILGVARPVGFSSDKGAYEYPTVIPRTEMKVSQGANDIMDNTGTFDFGDVSSTAPKTVTFTIANLGDLGLNLTGTPRVTVTGSSFALTSDAPATVAANGSVSFQITLSPTATAGNYAGTISIANNDADENPYNFAITGYGYDGNKALQTITFNTLPVKVSTDPNFNPGATSSAGLPIIYTSSNLAVATIVNGQIDLIAPGTATITASQTGDASINPARSVTQVLTVTPVLPPAGSNMVSNPTFDVNTTGWSFAYRNGGAATITSVPLAGSATNVGKVVVSNLGTGSPLPMDNVQIGTRVFLIKDRNYLISFKASADAPRNITMRLLMDVSPFATLHTVSNIPLTTTQSTFGTYAYTSTFTGYVALRFWVAGVNIPVYIDDVTLIEEPPIVLLPEMTLKQNGVEIADNAGTYSFGDVTMGGFKTVAFTIENTGNNNLNLPGNPRVTITGAGFSLVQDADANVATGGSTTFQVKFEPNAAHAANGTISIPTNDPNENPYNFTITGTGIKKNQSITFAHPAPITYGDAALLLNGTATSALPLVYTVKSGPGLIEGNLLSATGAGQIVVEATQAGDATFNAAAPVEATITVDKKELLVKADNKTVTYGDAVPALTYTISGFVFGQDASVLSGVPQLSTDYSPTTPATDVPDILTAVGSLSAANYDFKPENGVITILHTFPQQLEAELATITGGTVASIFQGFTGTGYVDHINKPYDYVQWTANVSGEGTATLKFRYALNNPSQDLRLTVNGVLVDASLAFVHTGSWRNWAVVSVPVYLSAGVNTIRLAGSGIAGPNFDNLVIENSIYQTSAHLPIPVKQASIQSGKELLKAETSQPVRMRAYPVPAVSELSVEIPSRKNEEFRIRIADMQGRIVYTKRYTGQDGTNRIRLNVSSFKPGSYLLEVTTSSVSQSQVIIINK